MPMDVVLFFVSACCRPLIAVDALLPPHGVSIHYLPAYSMAAV